MLFFAGGKTAKIIRRKNGEAKCAWRMAVFVKTFLRLIFNVRGSYAKIFAVESVWVRAQNSDKCNAHGWRKNSISL